MNNNTTLASIEANFTIENMLFDEPCRNRVRAVLTSEISVKEAISELQDKYREYYNAPMDAEPDRNYCYSGTDVLYNKLGLMDELILAEAERDFAAIRQAELYIEGINGDISLRYLCDIHRQLFQDIYTWAGKIRTVDIAKNTCFCLVQYIDSQFDYVYRQLRRDNFLVDIKSRDKMAERLAYYLGEINAIHPFREGNGRAQRIFIEQLCNHNGRFCIDYTGITPEDMIRASADSMRGDNRMLETLIKIS